MSKLDDAGLAVVAHFNRRGDVEGQRLFYMYTVEVEAAMREKKVLTIQRPESATHGKSKLDEPKKRNPQVAKIVDTHHMSESNARWAASRALRVLKQMNPEDRHAHVQDETLLLAWAKGWKVKLDHTQLFLDMVRQGAAEI